MYKLPRDLGISGVKLGVCVNADNNIIGPDLFKCAKVTSAKNEKIYLYSEWEQVSNHRSRKSRISQLEKVRGDIAAIFAWRCQANILPELHENERARGGGGRGWRMRIRIPVAQ